MSIRNKSDEKIYEELGKIKYSNISSTGKIFERLISGNLYYTLLNKKQNNKIISRNKNYNENKSTENILDEIIKKEKTFQKETFYGNEEMRKISNKLQIIKKSKEENLIPSNFKTIDLNKKNYNINQKFIKHIQEMKKKTPDLYYYKPNYNSIYKHIPIYKLKPINKKTIKKSSSQKNIKRRKKKNNESLNENNINSINNNNHIISFEKYTDRNKIINKPLSDNYCDFIMKKNILVPDFKRMISREKKNIHNQIESARDYSPNYNYIFCEKNLPDINVDLKRKKNLLRKILVNYNIRGEYLLIPKLNDNNKYM